jgi:hypothetical protein
MRENPRSPEETFPDLQHIIVIKQRQFKTSWGIVFFFFRSSRICWGGREEGGSMYEKCMVRDVTSMNEEDSFRGDGNVLFM